MKATAELEDKEILEEMPKSKSKMKAEKPMPTGIRMSDDLKASIEQQAEDEGISLGELCRQLIERGLTDNPARARAGLLRSVAITAAQFEKVLKGGALKDTEAEEQAEEIRRFFGQFVALLQGEKE